MIRFAQKANSLLVKHGIQPSVSLAIGIFFCLPLVLCIIQTHETELTSIVLSCFGISAVFLGVASIWYRRQGFPVREQEEDEQDDLAVDVVFTAKKPAISDLRAMTEGTPSSELGFHHLSHLGIEQVDDYFGITIEGDVIVWLFPIIDGEEVYHHHGPFDAIRIAYVVRTGRKDIFAKTLRAAACTSFTFAMHNGRQVDLKDEADIDEILTDA